MRYPYKYIPPCPKCGSPCTGRYVKEPISESDIEYVELKSYQYGEIVRFARREPEKNAFCVDCGYKWTYSATTRYLTKEEIEEQIDLRGTEPAYRQLKEEISQKNIARGKSKKGFF